MVKGRAEGNHMQLETCRIVLNKAVEINTCKGGNECTVIVKITKEF